MRRITTTPLPLLLVALVLAAGAWSCGDADEPAVPAVGAAVVLDPAALGSLGARIHAAPDRTEEILTDAGLDYAAFEEAVRDVAADVEASRQYRESFEATRTDPLVTAEAGSDPAS